MAAPDFFAMEAGDRFALQIRIGIKSFAETAMDKINHRIAGELGVQVSQVSAAVDLLNEGSTVPFIARYRKEKTGGLDDTQLRKLDERLTYLRELEDRRAAILKNIEEQGKLTPTLSLAIMSAGTKVDLEDLYTPYKQKRRTKAQIAREAGLEPLIDMILKDPSVVPDTIATSFINNEKGIADSKAALDGARAILIERIGENAGLVGGLRQWLWGEGVVTSKVIPGKEAAGAKFSDYFDFAQKIKELPSHRALALLRGRNEDILDLGLDVVHEDGKPHPAEGKIRVALNLADKGRPADKWLGDTVRLAWKARMSVSLSVDLMTQLKEISDGGAITVFSQNLKDLLLAAPAGAKVTMGIDPGIRTGCKIAVVDQTGKLLDTNTIYPHEPRNDWNGSLATLGALCMKHKVELISIGNGTAGRETDKLVAELIKKLGNPALSKIMVSEAGASVYSASELAANEFPSLDVSLRGAVSIARRLQDPLAELVKIDPKAIGVGQYQHDVDQSSLAKSLDAVVEDCVNSVGVDVNMASSPLLARVSGLNKTLADNIVAFRDENGAFVSRASLKKVPRLGPKAFEQAAGFLRIMNSKNPLDGSAVHPEAYGLVEKIATSTNKPVKALIGDRVFLKALKPSQFADENFGIPTITDILAELEKPGRDPRPEFKTATFKDGVEKISDLKPGMQLEGVVTNVTAFGAFVDIGVHQDGLVHISELADKFVKDPREVVKAGDVVKVRVKEVDAARKRIALSMKSGNTESNSVSGAYGKSSPPVPKPPSPQNRGTGNTAHPVQQNTVPGENALAAALRRAQEGKR
jgi:uncharacterized protein